jgi:hypothetical protein
MVSKNITNESSIENYFLELCKKEEMRAIKMIPTFEAGIPDRQVLYRGVSGFAEIKAPGKRPRKLQVVYMKNLQEAGFFVGIVDSRASAKAWLEDFKKYAEQIPQTTFCINCGCKNCTD